MKIKQNINIVVLFVIAMFLLSACKKNDITNDSGSVVFVDGPLCFTAEEPGASIGMFFNTMYGWIFDTVTKPNIEYSFDKVNWETLTISSISKDTTNSIVLENIGDKVYFRGENPHGLNPNYYDDMESCFSFLTNEKRIAISGNVMSLIDTTCNSKTAPDYCFIKLFDYTSITSAPELPATTVGKRSYQGMFLSCKNLADAPKLPAKTLSECCYLSMFAYCSGLTTAPKLPATTLAVDCYLAMFNWCWGLTSAPELPASVLPDFCYAGMFSRCANITSVKVHFTEWSYATNGWFAEVGTNGVFYCPASLPQEFGPDRIPEGWTVETF